jgi:hypothetical protein
MSETEYPNQQSSEGMKAQEFLDMSIIFLEKTLGTEQAAESVERLRQDKGNLEALTSLMMGIVLGLPDELKQKFADVSNPLESQDEKS